jgi:putative hydrolase of the HAD superfamily
VLAILGIRHHFDRIVDVRDMQFESKPQPSAYRRICALLDVRPEECVLVEDNIQNLKPAKAIGMATVLVHPDHPTVDGSADYVIAQVEEIANVMAQLATKT